MATTVGLFEAKTHLGQIVKRAASGEEIIITARGNPLVRLVPAVAGENHQTLKNAWERFQAIRKKSVLNPPGMPVLDIRELTKQGQK